MAPVVPSDVENQLTAVGEGEYDEPRPFSLKMPEGLQCYVAEAAGIFVMITIGLTTNM